MHLFNAVGPFFDDINAVGLKRKKMKKKRELAWSFRPLLFWFKEKKVTEWLIRR